MREYKFRTFDTKSLTFVGKFTVDEPDGCHIMQYTGLKDKNGKEIYEGDILGSGFENRDLGKVAWDHYGWVVVNKEYDLSYFNHPEAYEIIGNVFENPELLAAKDSSA